MSIRIGNRTTIRFLAPFDSVHKSDDVHTVLTENTFEGYRLSNNVVNKDIMTSVYANVVNAADVMESDIKGNAMLLTLMGIDGSVITVPSRYVVAVDLTNTHAYVEKAIVINIGAHELNLDITDLKKDIEGLILRRLGVRTKPASMDISKVIRLSDTEEKTLITSRKLLKSSDAVLHLSNQGLRDKVNDLNTKITALEEYIQNCK